MDNESDPRTTGPAASRGPDASRAKTPSPVREKTLRHLRGLLAKTALAGGAMQLTGCSQIVCDPLPPPVDCARGLTADDLMRLNVQAKWIQGAGGFTAKVDLIFYASNVTFSGEPILEGANLVSSDIGPRNSTSTPASFTFSPAAGVTMVRASLSVRCDDGATTTVHLTLDVSGTPQAGAAIPVTVKP